jgi:hypothetical protein
MNDYNQPILNPCYNYPDDYTPTMLNIDYSNLDWIWDPPDGKTNGRPVFRILGGDDHILSWKGPTMWDNKRYYSVSLTQALLNNGALTVDNWPSDLATIEETMSHWPFRTSANNYRELAQNTPKLKVMLVFSKDDHVQAAVDKPHIHQAYDGLKNMFHLWVRMNPDLSYIQSINSEYDTGFPDNPACEEPLNWYKSEIGHILICREQKSKFLLQPWRKWPTVFMRITGRRISNMYVFLYILQPRNYPMKL